MEIHIHGGELYIWARDTESSYSSYMTLQIFPVRLPDIELKALGTEPVLLSEKRHVN